MNTKRVEINMLRLTVGAALCGLIIPAFAALDVARIPLILNRSAEPRMMLLVSRDQQLYYKAYPDYIDLDGNGSIDTSYIDTFDYYGYFDANKCYVRQNNVFMPTRLAGGANQHSCGGNGEWSGNFLNWATMTRMDIVRRALYGGFRSTDTDSQTILERALLPTDIHSFAKFYNPPTTAEMRTVTPFAQANGITLCNLTLGPDNTRSGAVNTASVPPLMRVARGIWTSWASNERAQCEWREEPQSDTQADAVRPRRDGDRLTELTVRVAVCRSGLEEPNCVEYPNGNFKPEGIIQRFGKLERPIRFGLMTGSFNRNRSGGVLRKNIDRVIDNTAAPAANEIDANTGRFINQDRTDAGIINTLNRLRIVSYEYGDPYIYQEGCNSPGIASFPDGDCVDWGNPLSEMYLEALRYLSGQTSPTGSFNANDSNFIPSLPQVTWQDPIPAAEYCADTSIVAVSTGLNSFDIDQLTNNGIGVDAASQTNTVGQLEGINGGNYLIGGNGSINDGTCTGKSLGSLAQARGICPELPSLDGGYHIAGLAYYGRTNDLRPGSTYPDDQIVRTYSVALAETLPSLAIPVGSGVITLVPACQSNGDANANAGTSGWLACSLNDLRVENYQTDASGRPISGSFIIAWEDSSWGFDYDLDVTERLSFTVEGNQLNVTTQVLQAQAGFALRVGYTISGSTADGVYYPVIRRGGANFNIDSTSPADACRSPNGSTLPSSPFCTVTERRTQGTSSASLLENPLFYAAKYGSFNEIGSPANPSTPDDPPVPNLPEEWDADGDGLPDGFFRARNPAELEDALTDILNDVVSRTGSASAVASNSTRLDTNTRIYQARFNSADWSGELLAFPVQPDGSIDESTPDWEAGALIPDAANRNIYTFDPTTDRGIPFLYDDLNATQQAALNSTDNLGAERVAYLRGDPSQERRNRGTFRNRNTLLGDILNSDPWFSGNQNFGYNVLPGNEGTSYISFRGTDSYLRRDPLVLVGANDGMLHAFDARSAAEGGGVERFAFIPSRILPDLVELTSPNYQHRFYVDGAPRAADAYVDVSGTGLREWRTLVLGTAGFGGPSVFMLDITDPDNLDASNVYWEFTDADDPDLGLASSPGNIVRLANGEWAAVVSNGYNSATQTAALYLLNARTGAIIRKFSTNVGSASQPNGMSPPIVIDIDNDRIADAIFAGDLQGNLWYIDINDDNPNTVDDPDDWDFVFGNQNQPEPLFVACAQPYQDIFSNNQARNCASSDIQPITAPPEVGRGPNGTGVIVYVGTGRFFVTGDNVVDANTQTQTFYGVFVDPSQPRQVIGRSDLQQQSILTEQTVNVDPDGQGPEPAFLTTLRTVSQEVVDFNRDSGFYLDLVPPGSTQSIGERVVTRAILRGDRIIFNTLIPQADPCAPGGTSFLMELSALSGGALETTPFDINGDGVIDAADNLFLIDTNQDGVVDSNDRQQTISGKESTVGITKTPGILDLPDDSDSSDSTGDSDSSDSTGDSHSIDRGNRQEVKIQSGSSGRLQTTRESAATPRGRISWRDLPLGPQ